MEEEEDGAVAYSAAVAAAATDDAMVQLETEPTSNFQVSLERRAALLSSAFVHRVRTKKFLSLKSWIDLYNLALIIITCKCIYKCN